MSKELRCIWNMGDACDGIVQEQDMFDEQIRIPICEHHLAGHQEVMYLHSCSIDVEKVLQMPIDERNVLSGTMKDEADGFFVL